MEKRYQRTSKPWGKKTKNDTTNNPYAAYKNAIANGLRTTQELPIQDVEQFDDMIRHTQMHKKTNVAMTEWEQHFDKLQYGLTFDEDSPDVIDTSEDENCSKRLIQDDAGSSQDKSHNKYKTYSRDECAENMVKKCGQSRDT